MLHFYQEANRTSFTAPIDAKQHVPVQQLLSLLCGVSGWLGELPCVQGSVQGTNLYILFRNRAFLVGDFWESFGLTMATIHQTWPVSVFGTAENQETVQLLAEKEEKKIQFVQRSISRKSADVLETLCFQVDCTERETAQRLLHFLMAINWQERAVAISWQDTEFLREQGVEVDLHARGLFYYVGIDGETTRNDCLHALDFEQKIALWSAFLKDGFEPAEFEWMADEIAEGALLNRM